jgi:hypothetical protein
MANLLKAIDAAALHRKLTNAEKATMSALERTRKRILKPLYQQIQYYEEKLVELKRVVAGMVQGKTSKQIMASPAAKPTKKATKKAGGRRGKEELHRDALRAIAIIKSKGKAGASLKDLAGCGITGTPRQWLKTNAPGSKVVMRGTRASAKYFVD